MFIIYKNRGQFAARYKNGQKKDMIPSDKDRSHQENHKFH